MKPRQANPYAPETRRYFLRSLAFNIAFFLANLFICAWFIPFLFLPHRWFLAQINGFMRFCAFLERAILGLHMEVEGLENLPQGCYILAPKHQSVWETYKLHIWCNDPGVILKRELLNVPLWGWAARKMRVIAVDRGAGSTAIRSLLAGARRVKTEARPVVIFPQGTRVAPGVHAPYKQGVIALYNELKVPVVPVALNSGLFWPRKSFFKWPGIVRVRILPPIPPGLRGAEMQRQLEAVTEAASDALLPEGYTPKPYKRHAPPEKK